jgi:hypothetical protein
MAQGLSEHLRVGAPIWSLDKGLRDPFFLVLRSLPDCRLAGRLTIKAFRDVFLRQGDPNLLLRLFPCLAMTCSFLGSLAIIWVCLSSLSKMDVHASAFGWRRLVSRGSRMHEMQFYK